MRIYVICLRKASLIRYSLLAGFAALAVLTLLLDRSVISVLAPKENIPIYSVKTNGKQIALTFDAASGSNTTEKLLDIFDRYHIKVTFFVTGRWAELFEPELKQIAGRGHEIGSHGYRHLDFTALSSAQMIDELKQSSNVIERVTGKATTLFRAPYGAWNGKTVDAVCGQQYEFIQWDVDSLDWMGLSTGAMEKRVLPNVQSGSILLFHNDGKYTVDVLPNIIDTLQRRGFRFVTVTELLGESLETGGK